MPETDPYAVLGVPRSAPREEIARAYRRLAKRHHPDVGVPPSPTMARINEAWFVLSDAARRARWDREHAPVAGPPTWTAPVVQPVPPRPPAPAGAPTRRDSPWFAAAVVAGTGVLVAAVMVAANLVVAGSSPGVERQAADGFTIVLGEDWELVPAAGTDPPARAVLAHLVTFPLAGEERCRSFDDPCPLTVATLPPGQASVVVTGWQGGPPPVPDPVVSRPFGLDADLIVDGEPAAFELRRVAGGAVAWWQLSPPGFPDRWIELRAEIRGQPNVQDARILEINAMLATLEFTDPG